MGKKEKLRICRQDIKLLDIMQLTLSHSTSIQVYTVGMNFPEKKNVFRMYAPDLTNETVSGHISR